MWVLNNTQILLISQREYNFGLPDLYKLTNEFDFWNQRLCAIQQSEILNLRNEITISSLNLQELNYIIFPDWSTDEQKLGLELARVFLTIANYNQEGQITLLINTTGVSSEDANLIISAVIMNIMLEQEIDMTEKLQISMIPELTTILWQSLLPQLHGYLKIDCENQSLINQLNLPKTLTLNLE